MASSPKLAQCITAATRAALETVAGSGKPPAIVEAWAKWKEFAAGDIDSYITEMVVDPTDAATMKEVFQKFFTDLNTGQPIPAYDQITEEQLARFLQLQSDNFVNFMAEQMRRQGLQELVWARNFAPYVRQYADDPKALARLFRTYLVSDWAGKTPAPITLDVRIRSVLSEYAAKADAVFETIPPGLHNDAAEHTFNQAVAAHVDGVNNTPIGQAIKNYFDWSRERLNQFGSWIQDHPGYFPMQQDAVLLKQAGEDVWVRYHLGDNILDWERIKRPLTDEAYTTAREREGFLRQVYQRLLFDPARATSPADLSKSIFDLNAAPLRRSPLAERLGAERRLIYKDSAAREAARQRWSTKSNLEMFFGHMHSFSRYEALLQTFGPNPEETFNRMARAHAHAIGKANTVPNPRLLAQADALDQQAAAGTGLSNAEYSALKAEARALRERAQRERVSPPAAEPPRWSAAWFKQRTPFAWTAAEDVHYIQNPGLDSRWKQLLDEVMGVAALPVNDRLGLANAVHTTKNYAIGSFLGSALFAQWADLGATTIGLRLFGTEPYGAIMRVWGGFLAGSAHDREALARRLHVAETALGNNVNRTLEHGGPGGTKWSRLYSEASWDLQGARRWQSVHNAVSGAEIAAHLTDLRNVAWADLPVSTREVFRQAAIEERHWNLWRTTPPEDVGVATLITPEAVRARDTGNLRLQDETIQRFQDMATFWQRVLRPEPDARTRSLVRMGQRPGTIRGSIVELAAFLKTFPMTMALQHLNMYFRNPLARQSGIPRHIALITEFLAIGTLFGALGQEALRATRGQTPGSYDPTSSEGQANITQAVLRSGGLAFMGDALMSFEAQGTLGGYNYMAGPLLAAGTKSIDNAWQVVTGNRSVDRAAANFWYIARDFAPGRSYWPVALLYERLLLDQITSTFPTGSTYLSRKKERAREVGSSYYWAPGELAPEGVQ